MELGQKEVSKVKRNPESFISAMMLDIGKFKTINDMYGGPVPAVIRLSGKVSYKDPFSSGRFCLLQKSSPCRP